MNCSKKCNDLLHVSLNSEALIKADNCIRLAFDLKISLQFFATDDEDAGEDDESADTTPETEEQVPESEGSEPQDPEQQAHVNSEPTNSGTSGGGSNPLVDSARKKAQEGSKEFDKLDAKDGLNKVGAKGGDALKKGAGNIGDTVGGNVGNGIKNVGNIAGNNAGHLGDNASGMIHGDKLSCPDNAVEKAGAQAYDKAADVAAMAAGKAAAAAAGAPGVDKVVEAGTKIVLKNKTTKKALKFLGIGCLGGLMLLVFIPFILFMLGSEVLYALFGGWSSVLSGFFFFITFGIYDMNFSTLVEKKLDKIYSSTQEMPKEVVEDPSNTERPLAPKSADKGNTDKEYTKDVGTNIPRDRMRKYVQAEYSAMLYLQVIDLPPIGADGAQDIGTVVPAGKETKGEVGASILDAVGNVINNLIIEIETVELDLPTLYKLMDDEKNGGISFLEKLNLSLNDDESKAKIDKIINKYKNSFTTSYDLENLSAVGSPEAIKELKAVLLSEEKVNNNTYALPEGIESILEKFPTAESFFAPLEYSTGNPILYRGEDVAVYNKYILKEDGTFDEDNSEYNYEKSKALEAELKKKMAEDGGKTIIAGNPPSIKYNFPDFFSGITTSYDLQKFLAFFSGGRVTNFEDNTTRAFVMDIARLVYSNPEHRIANTPTNITLRLYPHSTITTTKTILEGTYTDSVGNIVTYSVPQTIVRKETKSEAFIVRIEDWDRIEEYSYAEITANDAVINIPDAAGNIVGTITTNEKYYRATDLPKTTVTSYPQKFTEDYELDEGDFGVYFEMTGRRFLADEVLYDLVTSEEYMAAFANSEYAPPLANLPEPSSYFGMRTLRGVSDNHKGVDFPVNSGTPVYAIADGFVSVASSSNVSTGYGVHIFIDHDGGKVQSRYAHLEKLKVKVNQEVKKGELIGWSDNTGNSTGPHLHFEIRLNGTPVNPLDVITSKPLDTSP